MVMLAGEILPNAPGARIRVAEAEAEKAAEEPRGYKIRHYVIDFPGGMPGDIGVTLSRH